MCLLLNLSCQFQELPPVLGVLEPLCGERMESSFIQAGNMTETLLTRTAARRHSHDEPGKTGFTDQSSTRKSATRLNSPVATEIVELVGEVLLLCEGSKT